MGSRGKSRRITAQTEKLADDEELTDVIGSAWALANELGRDVATTLREKICKNRQEHPADKYKGRYE